MIIIVRRLRETFLLLLFVTSFTAQAYGKQCSIKTERKVFDRCTRCEFEKGKHPGFCSDADKRKGGVDIITSACLDREFAKEKCSPAFPYPHPNPPPPGDEV